MILSQPTTLAPTPDAFSGDMPVEGGRKTALVTGGTGGIGAAVAQGVASHGWRVLITGRDAGRGAAVVDALRVQGADADHAFLPADLALMSDTARLGRQVLQRATRLDAVILCAGVLATRPEWTAEGLERCLAVNYLSRHLLLQLLQPRLTAAPSGRVVLVANAGKYPDTLDLDDLQHQRGRAGLRVAGRTQFANDVLAVELARRLRDTRVEVTCVYPGLVDTDVFRNARGPSARVRRWATAVQRVVGRSAGEAAVTPVALATDPELVGVSGRFYGPGMVSRRVPRAVRSDRRREAIWKASDELVRQ
jgi:NAD(P)-dependent dehydrogenase (short-subunit alcohol dehydrogenase family)